jgi:arylsulfatase A-like enzyme
MTDLVSLMDVGPTVLEVAGISIPTYFEGRSLMPYLRGEGIQPREFVFSEDNYQVMMRGERFKLVYYIGQEQGELYDLAEDPHELWNLWDDADHRDVKQDLLVRLLDWLASSTYWNAGYKRTRARETLMRWPTEEEVNLHGRPSIGNSFRDRW